MQVIRIEKHKSFSNLKTYEDQNDLSQRSKSSECINSSQINSIVTDVKRPKGTVAIIGDSIMSGLAPNLKVTIRKL